MIRQQSLRFVLIVGVLLVLLFLLTPVFSMRHMGLWDAITARQRMRYSMVTACQSYTKEHNGAWPPDLRMLFPMYLDPGREFVAYVQNEVEYTPGAATQTSPASVLIREKFPDSEGKQWEVHSDFSIAPVQPRRAPSPRP